MNSREEFCLLIGSIGDDSHSVGMALLEIAFREAGFAVKNLGILNTLDDFFLQAPRFDAVFISCMNGHADLYFNDFPRRLRQFTKTYSDSRVWYLGGNLSLRDDFDGIMRKYLGMGFDFVAPKPLPCEEIIERTIRHLGKKKARLPKPRDLDERPPPAEELSLDEVDDLPLSNLEFEAMRAIVLDSWPSGAAVRDAAVKANHGRPEKNLSQLLLSRNGDGALPLLQPRTGVAHVGDEIDILLHLRRNGLDISSIQLDAASRKKMFHKAEEGVGRTLAGGASCLNGFPVPVHGVEGIRRIVEAIDTPFQIRAGSPDHRLVYEIGLAGGASSLEGGFLCYLLPYDKHTSPLESSLYWKYVDTLAGLYRRKYGITINREYFGPLTCCLMEPTIPICINIIEAILSAKAGVACVSVGLAEQGNRVQDIAALQVLDKMTRRYLEKHQCTGVAVSTVYHQYMAAFPRRLDKAMDVIFQSSITGALSGASRVMTKTFVEAHHIPTKEDNARSLALCRQGMLASSRYTVDHEAVTTEARFLERQVECVMDAIEALGRGSITRGAIRAVESGLLDVLWSPNRHNANKLLAVRDTAGAIRFINPEILPFPADIIDRHKEAVHRRMTAQRQSRIFKLIETDLTRVWQDGIGQWPLDAGYLS